MRVSRGRPREDEGDGPPVRVHVQAPVAEPLEEDVLRRGLALGRLDGLVQLRGVRDAREARLGGREVARAREVVVRLRALVVELERVDRLEPELGEAARVPLDAPPDGRVRDERGVRGLEPEGNKLECRHRA